MSSRASRAACAAALAGGATRFAGGDLEHPGVLREFLHARAPDKNLVFISVADTRDHRRQHKDPALKTISIDFTLNLINNLRRIGLENFGILSTPSLCRTLQQQHCLYACAWTSLWHSHPGLAAWSLRPGDMFLMWAQQWHYIAQAVTLGYSVLRTDTDVYLAENPFPILRGPLLRPFRLVVQQDFGGPLGSRPACRMSTPIRPRHNAATSTIASCGAHRGTALLNIGLLFIRGIDAAEQGGRGALAVINGTWARFLEQIGKPRPTIGSGAAAQPQHVESLIDQPLMRAIVGDLSAAEPGKPTRQWTVVPGSAAAVYDGLGASHPAAAVASCALRDAAACARVQSERSQTAFLAQLVRPRRPGSRARQQQQQQQEEEQEEEERPDRIALAPDWLFGRGCLLTVRNPLALLASTLQTTAPISQTRCELPPAGGRLAQPAPGPAAGLLVATHFVYSMALKRKRTFRAFAWDAVPAGVNRTWYPPGEACWRRSKRAMLFSHTFMAQTGREFKAVLCSLPRGDGPECACCVGVTSVEGQAAARQQQHSSSLASSMETTGGYAMRWNAARASKLAAGCNDYQMFWD